LPTINSVKEVIAQLQEMRTAKKEHFVALYLNSRNQLVNKEIISIGTLNSGIVHPREVFKPAIDCLVSSIIVAHNHPSGSPIPSEKDIELTKRLVEAGKILGIEILDHVIITNKDSFSFKEKFLI
jgi:DNA repair protein RadC